jgi:hypothetical protein
VGVYKYHKNILIIIKKVFQLFSSNANAGLAAQTGAVVNHVPLHSHSSRISGGQVTFKKELSYFTSVTSKSNSLLLIRYSFFIVTVPLQLLVTDILNVTK